MVQRIGVLLTDSIRLSSKINGTRDLVQLNLREDQAMLKNVLN
jgi:hypothetical protein